MIHVKTPERALFCVGSCTCGVLICIIAGCCASGYTSVQFLSIDTFLTFQKISDFNCICSRELHVPATFPWQLLLSVWCVQCALWVSDDMLHMQNGKLQRWFILNTTLTAVNIQNKENLSLLGVKINFVSLALKVFSSKMIELIKLCCAVMSKQPM